MGQLVTHNNRLNAAPRITVHRLPYEEPYHTQLEIEASNGVFALNAAHLGYTTKTRRHKQIVRNLLRFCGTSCARRPTIRFSGS